MSTQGSSTPLSDTPRERPSLGLFPLQTVLFPGGILGLKVFEARYLDLMGHCLRNGDVFGVVCLQQGGEVQKKTRSSEGTAPDEKSSAVRIESTATLARLDEVDAEQAGILQIRCVGTRRVRLSTPWQQADGLWRADAQEIDEDTNLPPPEELAGSVGALKDAIASLRQQGLEPFALPHRMDDAGWVANRWCEILPISLAAKQRLMELEDPVMRLRLVDEFLRTKGVVRNPKRSRDG